MKKPSQTPMVPKSRRWVGITTWKAKSAFLFQRSASPPTPSRPCARAKQSRPALAPEQLCAHDMLVRAAWQGRNFAIPLSQLMPVATDPSTHEAIADWHYWVARGYLL
jgi:hypothetical protein